MLEDSRNFNFNVVLLRFLAITSVVVYHLLPTKLPYGYIGVDIFFVISGYLILSNNLKKLNQKLFSTVYFYVSRLKRLIPATYFLLLIVTIFSFFIFIHYDFLNYAHSLKSSILFRSNYYFNQHGGYFGTNDLLKPLLHLWSLSIEAQFYLYFPLFLILLSRFKNYYKILIILILSFISFYYNLYLDNIQHNSGFFYFTTRFWEFGIGMFVALLPKSVKLINYKYLSYFQLFFIIIIIVSFFLKLNYLPNQFFAVIFSGLIIWSSKEIFLTKFSSIKKIISYIAGISFSLYLLHWPIIVFFNYYYPDGVPTLLKLFYIPILIVISNLYFRYFENSILNKRNSVLIIFTIFIFSLLILLSQLIIRNDGFPSRFSTTVNTISSAVNSNFRCPDDGSFALGASKRACFIGDLSQPNVTVALLGNSHAQMYAGQVSILLNNQGKKGLLIPLEGCLPFIEYNLSKDCLQWANINLDYILLDPHIRTVIVGSTWYSDLLTDKYGRQINDIQFQLRKDSIASLEKKFKEYDKKFYLIGPIQIPFIDYASSMSRRLAFHEKESILSIPRLVFDKRFMDLINFSSALLGSNYLPAHEYLCDDNYCFFTSNKEVYFADSNHLSTFGAARMMPLFAPISF